MFFPMQPWEQRTQTARQLVGENYGKTGDIKEGLSLFFNPPAIQGLGQTGGFEFYLQNKGDGGVRRLAEMLPQLMAEANKQPELQGVKTLWHANSPQLFVNVDNEKARMLKVSVTDVYNALAATLGSYYVNDFNMGGHIYQVLVQAEGNFRAKPDCIGVLFVSSNTGQMVPIRSLAEV